MCEWMLAVKEAYESKKRCEQLQTKIANTQEQYEIARAEAIAISPRFAQREEAKHAENKNELSLIAEEVPNTNEDESGVERT